MKFPNALKGVKKIYAAEILSLLATICVSILSGLAQGSVEGIALNENTLAILGILLIVGAVLGVVAGLLNLIGVSNASKDESSFKNAMIWIIIGLAASIAMGYFQDNAKIFNVLNIVQRLANTLKTVYVIIGVTNLAQRLGDKAQAERGKKVQNIIVAIFVIGIVFEGASDFMGNGNIPDLVIGILGLAALVLMIAAYCMFLKLLSRARKMLEK